MHSINVNTFFTKDEVSINKNINFIKFYEKNMNGINCQIEKENANVEELETFKEDLKLTYQKLKMEYKNKSDDEIIKELKKELKAEIKSFKGVRKLEPSKLSDKTVISQFESSFTRALNIKTNTLTDKFIVVEITYYDIMDQLIDRGFTYNEKLYEFAFASAGQIREKKLVFIESEIYKAVQGKLFAGLTDEMINDTKIGESKGIVTGKLLAYKALCNSSSVEYKNYIKNKLNKDIKFDINKVIVVPDFEYEIKEVEHEYINSKFEINTVKDKSLINPVVDGAGICLPSFSKNNLQFRAPWIKGLLTPFDYIKFAKVNGINKPVVKDAWGKEWDLKDHGIQIILTESQLKMRKYYESWEHYKEEFNNNKCEFSICNEESLQAKDFRDSSVSYQMIQTLYDITNEELEGISSFSKQKIKDIITAAKMWTDRNKTKKEQNTYKNLLLSIAGINTKDDYKRPIHHALNLCDELLYDKYIQSTIRKKKEDFMKDARSGKLKIEGSRTVYVLPDVIAFGQHLFDLEVTGGLDKGEVSCKLFEEDVEFDMLRSPHLYIEHSINTNKLDKIINEDRKLNIKDWYKTNGVYVSINSTASFELAYDVDGDTLILIPDTTKSGKEFVKVAKRHAKHVLPLDYEMSKGDISTVDKKNIKKSLRDAFNANIGEISYKIAKVFNKDEITDQDIEDVKLLKYMNNMEIDYAKTGFRIKPENKNIKERLKGIDYIKKEFVNEAGEVEVKNVKVNIPYFFIDAKNKTKDKVESCNNSTMNRINALFNNKNFDNLRFAKGEFNHKWLMNNVNIEFDEVLNKRYDYEIKKNSIEIQKQIKKSTKYVKIPKIVSFKEKITEGYNDDIYIVDSLIKYLYETTHKEVENEDGEIKEIRQNKTKNLFFLWEAFGETLIHNFKMNLLNEGKLHRCACDEIYKKNSNNQSECKICAKEVEMEKARLRKQNQRKKAA